MTRPDRERGAGEKLVRTLLGLPEIGIRVPWLVELLGTRDDELPALLDFVAGLASRGEPRGREALLSVALALVRERDSSSIEWLRRAADERHLLQIERLVRDGPDPPPVEPPEIVPNYGAARELSVGERKSLARRPTRVVLDKLLFDPHPLVLRQLLTSSKLTEVDVIRVAARRPLGGAAVDALAHFPNWLARPRIRLALVLNPYAPHRVALPLVSTFPREDLRLIVQSTTISATLRTVAHELVERLPPLPPLDDPRLQ